MASKGKQAEVNSARIRLDATLQHLVDRKEECHETSEGESIAPLTDSTSKPSPRKSASKASRKRKRRDDTSDYENVDEQQTVIMKLFDRSVDLALFPEDTPLYPVCRAWLQNRPHDKTLGTLCERPTSPKLDEEQSHDVYPDIYEMPQAIKSEDGCLYDLRIPEPVPQPVDRLDIDADPKTILPSDQLLLNHMNRWKEVRNRWREASILHEMQYMGSINLLKEMFDRNL